MCHELAMNPHIQDRLYDEIAAIEATHTDNPISYETIQSFKYMDMVVSEALRLWPPIPGSDRQVTKPYRMELSNGKHIDLKTNDAIWLPIYGIHLDAQYWPDPQKFDPERFNDENRKNIQLGTYLPFGNGQRVCIASRFAILVAKTIFYHLLKKYRFETCAKTSIPIVLKPNSINMHAKDGFWVKFKSREMEN